MTVAVGSIVINRYEVLQEVGEGGFAWVYKARDNELGRIVALKVLKSHYLRNDEDLERFQREALFLAKLLHPHIVQVYAFEIVGDSQPCLVMEYLEGQSLAKYLAANGKLTPSIFNHVFLQICSALAYAHKLGFVHRDLTPANIYLTGDVQTCDVKIIDFGLSKLLTETSNKLTQTGLIIGTAAYMSPELVRGQGIDQRSDIYSLGCVMFEALTARAAFTADSPISILVLQQQEYPIEPNLGLADKQQERLLCQIMLKCLQKDPVRRFASCDELERTLIQAFETGQVDASVCPGCEIDTWAMPGAKPRPAMAPFALAFLLIGLLAAVGAAILNSKTHYYHETSQATSAGAGLLKAASIKKRENQCIHSLELAIKEFGVNSINLVAPISALASCYCIQHKFLQAEVVVDQLLAIQEKSLEPNDPALADTLHCLASICCYEHKYSKAEMLAKRALAITERSRDLRNEALRIGRLESLCNILCSAGNYTQAKALRTRMLHIKEKLFISAEPERVSWEIRELAKVILKLNRNRFADAEALFRKALAIDEANVSQRRQPEFRDSWPGELHFDQALGSLKSSYLDLADCLLQQKTRIKEAEALIKHVLNMVEGHSSSPHRIRVQMFNKLSCCYRLQGKLKEAEHFSKQALAQVDQAPAAGDVDQSLNDTLVHLSFYFVWEIDQGLSNYELASCYFEEGRLREAEQGYKRALAFLEAGFAQDSDCVLPRQGLAQCYSAEGKNAEAEQVMKANSAP